MQVFHTNSAAETEEIGERLGRFVPDGAVIAMFGDLGAGKTAFTRGVARGMEIPSSVSSPTFSLVNEYRSAARCLYHFDMYRINGWEDLYSTGYFDYLDTGAVLIIEWSENIETVLPPDHIRVEIEKREAPEERMIRIGRGESFEDISC